MSKVIVTVVHWLDASFTTYGDRHTGLLGCVACGIVIEEDDQVLILAGMVFDNDDEKHCLSIPKSLIRKRRDITFSRKKVK